MNESDVLAAAIQRTKPDIVVDCCVSEFETIFHHVMVCVENGVDVITTSDTTYYPRETDPEKAEILDRACKEHGVSVCAVGIQDCNWSGLALLLMANCNHIDAIYGENWCMSDYWGAEAAVEETSACLTAEEFAAKHSAESGVAARNCYTYSLYEIADELGLHVIKETNQIEPIFCKNGYTSPLNGAVIQKGLTIGRSSWSQLETEEGITLRGTFYQTFAEDGFDARNTWTIKGDPDMRIVEEDMHGECVTQYDVINRIPDVINARPGLLTVKDLPKPMFRANKNLGTYVK